MRVNPSTLKISTPLFFAASTGKISGALPRGSTLGAAAMLHHFRGRSDAGGRTVSPLTTHLEEARQWLDPGDRTSASRTCQPASARSSTSRNCAFTASARRNTSAIVSLRNISARRRGDTEGRLRGHLHVKARKPSKTAISERNIGELGWLGQQDLGWVRPLYFRL